MFSVSGLIPPLPCQICGACPVLPVLKDEYCEQHYNFSIFRWFLPHWIIQFVVAGPIIFAGWALGYRSAQELQPVPPTHFFDTHLKCGLALLILYLIQLVLGASAHFFKFRRQLHGHRAPHNYLHAAVGIAIFILAAYQVCYFVTFFALSLWSPKCNHVNGRRMFGGCLSG